MRRISTALWVSLCLVACSQGSSLPPAVDAGSNAPPALMQGVRFGAYRFDGTDLELRARSAEIDWANQEVRLTHVTIQLPEEARGPLEVQSESGRISLATEGFVLEGGVTATTADGRRFETRSLRYEPKERALVTSDPVRVTGGRLEVEGSGMEVDVPTRRVRLLGPVRATTEPG